MSFVRLILVLVALFLCSSCMRDHHQSIAELEYFGVHGNGESSFFDINFSSNMDIDKVYPGVEESHRISQLLVCSLESPPVFSMAHVIPASGMALFRRNYDLPGYGYTARMYFSETKDNGVSESLIYRGRFEELVFGRSVIPCKVRMTAFGYKAYYSNSMFVPVVDLLPIVPEKIKAIAGRP